MKNQLTKFALEDSHNREVVAGCYGRGKSSARFFFAERGGLNIGKGDSKKRAARKGEFWSGIPIWTALNMTPHEKEGIND